MSLKWFSVWHSRHSNVFLIAHYTRGRLGRRIWSWLYSHIPSVVLPLPFKAWEQYECAPLDHIIPRSRSSTDIHMNIDNIIVSIDSWCNIVGFHGMELNSIVEHMISFSPDVLIEWFAYHQQKFNFCNGWLSSCWWCVNQSHGWITSIGDGLPWNMCCIWSHYCD